MAFASLLQPTIVATFLLPDAARFGAQRLSRAAAVALGRADRYVATETGRRALLRRHFEFGDHAWPIAALSRQTDAGDAEGAAWLRADPAWLRPDINGVRLMAHGEALAPTQDDCDALLPALRPLFGDAGFTLDAPAPARWYLQLPREAPVPDFPDPGDTLGDDLFEHADTSPEGRKWRALASEAQVVLHNHPWNAQRAARGLAPINALWFWGGGVLPVPGPGESMVYTWHGVAYTDEDAMRAIADVASLRLALPPKFDVSEPGDHVFDLGALRDLAVFERDWLLPALAQVRSGRLTSLALDGEDGRAFVFRRWHPLRFWRRPKARLDG